MGADPYIGEISIFAGNFEPRGWAFCDGRLLAISQFSALFSLLGTFYGGDGRSNFALPDLRGRSVVGAGNGPGLTPRPIGNKGGAEYVNLTTNEMPQHTHGANTTLTGNITAQLKGTGEPGNKSNPLSNFIAAHTDAFIREGTLVDMNSNAIEVSNTLAVNTTIDPAGGGNLHENMHPWLATNYIIALEGIFPSRT